MKTDYIPRVCTKYSAVTLLSLLLFACGGSSEEPSKAINAVPLVNAGVDQTVNGNESVSLSGSGSDSDGSISSYVWTQKSGTSVSLLNNTLENANFIAPINMEDETLSFEFAVTDNDGATSKDIVLITVNKSVNDGGKPSNPSAISFEVKNRISVDAFDNYFEYDAKAGEQIFIHATLESRLDDQMLARCGANPEIYYTGIKVIGEFSSCSKDLKYTFLTSGVYQFNIGFPYANIGFFDAVIVGDSNDTLPTTVTGYGGQPDSPALIDFDSDNIISGNNINNYYQLSVKAGDTLTIQTYSEYNATGTDNARCANNGSFHNSYAYGIAIDDEGYDCNPTYSKTFVNAGEHIIHFRFLHDSAGYFRASLAK